jgi:hypothetical protein
MRCNSTFDLRVSSGVSEEHVLQENLPLQHVLEYIDYQHVLEYIALMSRLEQTMIPPGYSVGRVFWKLQDINEVLRYSLRHLQVPICQSF